ncbi:MAG: TlpA disulfide reductase family protein [Candidatus Omnitrophota bacterium]|jgi:cytochrome c biogenesis protein CcmG/thiol:disulfide interchange protein DsbE
MKKMASSKIFAFIAALFLLGACAKSSAVEIGETAPDFTLHSIDGKTVSLSEFKGKVVILDFFASWCPPCRQEIPDFIELQKAYGDKGFVMIGVSLVNMDESKKFASQKGINYPVVMDDEKVSGLYGPIRSIPTTFVLDRDLKIVRFYIGARPKSVFENDIKELLK